MQKDFISVCIITKDEEPHLLQTLKYLVNQTYGKENFEIVIVDGNSKDNTIAAASVFLEKEKMHYTIVNEKEHPNKWWGYDYGHSFARNVSIDVADPKSSYIAQIDADCRAAPDWLETLRNKIKDSGSDIAGAGWPRLVEEEWEISKFELMLNHYFTSPIMTLWNPAFCVRKGLTYIPSIAGYNSIYKAEILRKYLFNTHYATFFDDIEINYRLAKDKYKFLYAPEAQIWHRLDESIWDFFKHMAKYGAGAAKMTKYYKSVPRIYVYLSVGYFLYSLAVLPLSLLWSVWFLLPYILVFVLATAVFIENFKKTKNLISLWTYPLVFGHPFMYGYGFLRELFRK